MNTQHIYNIISSVDGSIIDTFNSFEYIKICLMLKKKFNTCTFRLLLDNDILTEYNSEKLISKKLVDINEKTIVEVNTDEKKTIVDTEEKKIVEVNTDEKTIVEAENKKYIIYITFVILVIDEEFINLILNYSRSYNMRLCKEIKDYILENTQYVITLFNNIYTINYYIIYNMLINKYTKEVLNNIYLTSDKKFMEIAIIFDINNVCYLNPILLEDFDFLYKLYDLNYNIFQLLPYKLRNNEKFVLPIVSNRANQFKFVSKKLRATESVVIAAISNRGYQLCYANKILKSNPRIVLLAVKNNLDALKYADYSLTNNYNFMLETIKLYDNCYIYASERLQMNYVFNIAAVQINGNVYLLLNNIMKQKIKIIFEAIKNQYKIINYINKELLLDRQFYIKLLTINPKIICDVPDIYKDDFEIFTLAINIDGVNIMYASDNLKDNDELGYLAVTNTGYSIRFLSDRLKYSYSFMKISLTDDAKNIIYLTNIEDIELIKMAIASNTHKYVNIYMYLSNLFKINKEIILLSLKTDNKTIKYIEKHLFDNDIIRISITCIHDAIKYIPIHLLNEDIIKTSVTIFGSSIIYVPESFLTNELCEIAIAKNIKNIMFINKKYINKHMIISYAKYIISTNLEHQYKFIDIQSLLLNNNKLSSDIDLILELLSLDPSIYLLICFNNNINKNIFTIIKKIPEVSKYLSIDYLMSIKCSNMLLNHYYYKFTESTN